MLFQKLIIFSYWACFRQMKCTYLTLGQKPSLDQVPLESTTQVVGQASCGCLGIFFASQCNSVVQSFWRARNGKSTYILSKKTLSCLWIKRMMDFHYFSGVWKRYLLSAVTWNQTGAASKHIGGRNRAQGKAQHTWDWKGHGDTQLHTPAKGCLCPDIPLKISTVVWEWVHWSGKTLKKL